MSKSLETRNIVLQKLPHIPSGKGLVHNIALATGSKMRDVESALQRLAADGLATKTVDGFWCRTGAAKRSR